MNERIAGILAQLDHFRSRNHIYIYPDPDVSVVIRISEATGRISTNVPVKGEASEVRRIAHILGLAAEIAEEYQKAPQDDDYDPPVPDDDEPDETHIIAMLAAVVLVAVAMAVFG